MPHDVSDACLCERPIFDAVQDAATRAQLHDQVDILIVLEHALHSSRGTCCLSTVKSADPQNVLNMSTTPAQYPQASLAGGTAD